MRRLVGFVVVLTFIAAISGCKDSNAGDSDKASAYLQQKYGESFAYNGTADGGYCFASGGNVCFVQNTQDGYRDNYQAVLYEQDIYNYFQGVVSNCFSEKSRVSVNVGDGYLGDEKVLDYKQFLRESSDVTVEVCTDVSYRYKEEDLRKISNSIKGGGFHCDVKLYYISPEYMTMLERGEKFDTSSAMVLAMGSAKITSDGNISMSWNK